MDNEFNRPSTEKAANRPPPPKLDSILRDAFHNHKGHWPRMIPREPFEAADYWASMNEPAKERERPEWISKSTPHDQHAGGWQTPYIDRVLLTLRIFLTLKPNDQAFVAEIIRAGYPWRGDDLAFYRDVIKNTDIMRGYIDEHGRAADGLLPQEYTAMILKEVRKLAAAWTSNLPYDKNERVAQ